jgi:hypothetical protein
MRVSRALPIGTILWGPPLEKVMPVLCKVCARLKQTRRKDLIAGFLEVVVKHL